MKLELHRNSLFAILLRSPWWVSGLAAAAVFGLTRMLMAVEFAAFAASPFIVIALYIAWKRLRAPSSRSIGASLERMRGMSWDEFSEAIAAAFRRDGYTVTRLKTGADFQLEKSSRTTLLSCKRWKATRTGIEPLRELDDARRAAEAVGCIYVATGEVTAQARALAAEQGIRILEGAELAMLLSDRR
jgi:restriction system protein